MRWLRGRRRGPRGQHGFTLVELLVTMAITVIGLMGLMSLFVVTARGNSTAAQSAEGVAVGQATLEEVRTMSLQKMFTEYGVVSLPIDTSLNTVAGRAGTTFSRRLQVTELTAVSTNLIKIRVDVGWTEAGATPGAEGGLYDHRISFELIRTASEAL